MFATIFFDVISIAIVVAPILLAIGLLGGGSWRRRAMLCRDLGIPVGILFALIGMVQMLAAEADMGALYGATAVMLLTIFYGGVVSAMGFFFERLFAGSHPDEPGQPPSIVMLVLAVVGFLSCVASAVFSGSASIFVDGAAVGVWLLFLIAALLVSSRETRPTNVARALLFASMVCVVAGLIVFFAGDQVAGLSLAINGLIYGLMSYVTVYLICFQRGLGEPINAPLTNWHWMEVTGFYIFMFLAPDTILDNLQDAAIADRFEAMEQKVQDLQKELDNIDRR